MDGSDGIFMDVSRMSSVEEHPEECEVDVLMAKTFGLIFVYLVFRHRTSMKRL